MNEKTAIALGSTVKDTLTAFTGKAISRTEALYTLPMVLVVAPGLTPEGKPVEHWIDEPRLEVVSGV